LPAFRDLPEKAFTRPGDLQQKVQAEVDVLRCLGAHPNIVSFVESMTTDDCFHLVMEHLGGGESMGGNITEEPLAFELAMQYFCDAVAGVAHLHRHNVLHLDLKPQNMILDAAGTLKLVDFGTARKMSHSEEMILGAKGTPMFWAPECCNGEVPHLGQQVDIWALGVTLHQFLTGQVLFVARTLEELRGKLLHTEVELPLWLPEDLTNLLSGMLCKNTKERLTIQQVRDHPSLAVWLALYHSKHSSITAREEIDASSQPRNSTTIEAPAMPPLDLNHWEEGCCTGGSVPTMGSDDLSTKATGSPTEQWENPFGVGIERSSDMKGLSGEAQETAAKQDELNWLFPLASWFEQF